MEEGKLVKSYFEPTGREEEGKGHWNIPGLA